MQQIKNIGFTGSDWTVWGIKQVASMSIRTIHHDPTIGTTVLNKIQPGCRTCFSFQVHHEAARRTDHRSVLEFFAAFFPVGGGDGIVDREEIIRRTTEERCLNAFVVHMPRCRAL